MSKIIKLTNYLEFKYLFDKLAQEAEQADQLLNSQQVANYITNLTVNNAKAIGALIPGFMVVNQSSSNGNYVKIDLNHNSFKVPPNCFVVSAGENNPYTPPPNSNVKFYLTIYVNADEFNSGITKITTGINYERFYIQSDSKEQPKPAAKEHPKSTAILDTINTLNEYTVPKVAKNYLNNILIKDPKLSNLRFEIYDYDNKVIARSNAQILSDKGKPLIGSKKPKSDSQYLKSIKPEFSWVIPLYKEITRYFKIYGNMLGSDNIRDAMDLQKILQSFTASWNIFSTDQSKYARNPNKENANNFKLSISELDKINVITDAEKLLQQLSAVNHNALVEYLKEQGYLFSEVQDEEGRFETDPFDTSLLRSAVMECNKVKELLQYCMSAFPDYFDKYEGTNQYKIKDYDKLPKTIN